MGFENSASLNRIGSSSVRRKAIKAALSADVTAPVVGAAGTFGKAGVAGAMLEPKLVPSAWAAVTEQR